MEARKSGSIPEIEKKIAEDGKFAVPIKLIWETFAPMESEGTMTFYDTFCEIKTSFSESPVGSMNLWISAYKNKMLSVTSDKIAKGKQHYYQYKHKYFLDNGNENTNTPFNLIDIVKPKGLLSDNHHTFPYQDLKRIALFGKLMEVEEVGLLNLEYLERTNNKMLIDFMIKKKTQYIQRQAKQLAQKRFEEKALVQILKRFTFFLIKVIVVIGLFRLIVGKSTFYDPIFWIFIGIFLPAVIGYNVYKKTEMGIGTLNEWQAIKQTFLSIFQTGHPIDWLTIKEEDDYLECTRLLFDKSLVFPANHLATDLKNDPIMLPPLTIDPASKTYASKENPSERFSVLDISEIIFSPKGIGVINNDHRHHIELNPKEFESYIGPLLKMVGDKFKMVY